MQVLSIDQIALELNVLNDILADRFCILREGQRRDGFTEAQIARTQADDQVGEAVAPQAILQDVRQLGIAEGHVLEGRLWHRAVHGHPSV